MESSAPSSVTLEPGVVLAGKYRIERILGQGGMGIVAAAYHLQLEQRVALKLMLPHAATSAEAVARFLREARAAARISSDHVVRVFDVGALETGEPYIAMEYLEGLDVAQLLARQGRLATDEAIDFLLQACEALAEAHSAGIVHRDLKPANLFVAHRVDGQRLVKVLDFGISKMTGAALESNAPATRTSALMGSPLYMSPEQMGSSKAVDARSDVWALGVVLYEMLCGEPPFNGETLPQVCAMVMTEDPPALAARAPGLPPELYEVVRRCLEKQPAARFQSVAQVAQALEPLASLRARQSVDRILRVQGVTSGSMAGAARASSVPAVTGPLTGSVPATSQPHLGTYAPLTETKSPSGAGRSVLPIVLGTVVLGLAGAGLWLAQRSGETTSTAASARAATNSAPAPVPDTPALAVTGAPSTLPSGSLYQEPSETTTTREARAPVALAPSALAPSARPSRKAAAAVKSTVSKPETKPALPAATPAPSPAAPVASPAAAPTTRSRL